jgi:arabinogalactan endo-1,4-beta-galactosidase
MNRVSHRISSFAAVLLGATTLWRCSPDTTSADLTGGTSSTGGAPLTGGSTSTGGSPTTSSGGASAGTGGSVVATTGGSSGGVTSGGATNSGGATATGGSAGDGGAGGDTGGAGGAESSSGGAGSGGKSGSGGTSTGGTSATGGVSTGGSSGLAASFYIGADITWVQADEARGATYSDGTKKDILQLLKDHGFNTIRLRTFVDPKAADGYDKTNGYGDLAHTIAFGKRIKQAGMGLLVDFHYSDNWADPGKQCVPVAWQSLTTIGALATAVHDYTKDAITQLIAGGARPDMVQVGNETTPGMLLHRCDSGGQPTGSNPVAGSVSNWTNLGLLMKAGSDGVKEVDPNILVMLHIDKGGTFNTSRDYITNAKAQGVVFEVFGESCYTAYQGQPSTWQANFTQLAAMFPTLKFVVAEYGPEQRAAHDVVFNLPNQQGLGSFNWEPTHAGAWNTGHVLFNASGNTYTATADLALYDQMKTAYASRL